jgi:peroxiredoxin (alkyl hydroperoxide reductase subunit C)
MLIQSSALARRKIMFDYTIGDKFPDFSAVAVDIDNTLIDIDVLQENMWSVVYFYPKDFTFICPTEIADMDRLLLDADVLGFSPDNEYCKLAWKESNDIIRNIQHPLCCDAGSELAKDLGVYNDKEGVPYRATYIIDPEGVIQHYSVNALDTGRNAEEILRTLNALQSGGLTGCSWQPGDDFVG